MDCQNEKMDIGIGVFSEVFCKSNTTINTMSKGKGNCKEFGRHDIIECRICGKRMERRNINSHFETYAIAKNGYPNHPNTSNKIHELQDPTDYGSKILKTRTISSFFKKKKNNQII